MNFVVLGTSEFSILASNAIIESGNKVLAMISMPENQLPNNSSSISFYAKQKHLSYHEFDDINSLDSIKLLREYSPDYLFVSWPKIINKDVLNIPKYFCIGTHPTNLPHNRGRHPLHWIIALGISETKLSFFAMDEGIDNGDILLQVPFLINYSDTIKNVNDKMNNVVYESVKELCKKLDDTPFNGKKQNHKMANYWRKRTPHDITLDLRMSADLIIRIVRSFTSPYPCANLIFKSSIIKIQDAIIVKTNLTPEEKQRIEPGKIIRIEKKILNVKVDDEIIQLITLKKIPDQLFTIKYIHPPSNYFHEHNIVFED